MTHLFASLTHLRTDLPLSAFPLTAKYDPKWIRDNALRENALCPVESLARHLPLRAGMRAVDLGLLSKEEFLAHVEDHSERLMSINLSSRGTSNHKMAVLNSKSRGRRSILVGCADS